MILLSFGCATNPQPTPLVSASSASIPGPPSEYVIQPGDKLDIKFFYNPELNESVTVRPDGKISLQLIDDVQAAGRTPPQLDQLLTQKYESELRKPVVTVIVQSFSSQKIYVGGEVNQQGEIDLVARMTPLQAVLLAGGFKETAQPKEAIVIRKGENNRPVAIRIDLASAIYGTGSGADFKLVATDIVYVPKSAIAEANKWVNQYIEKLILFRGVSFGMSYQINKFYE